MILQFARPLGQGRVRASASIRYIFINDKRAREASPRSHFAKEDVSPSAWPSAGAFFAPLGRPKPNIHRLFCGPGALQKSTHFWDPSKSTPWVAKSQTETGKYMH